MIFAAQALAIEGIHVAVQSTNAVLSAQFDGQKLILSNIAPASIQRVLGQRSRIIFPRCRARILLRSLIPILSSMVLSVVVEQTAVAVFLLPGGTNSVNGTNGLLTTAGTGFYRVVRDGGWRVPMWGITNGMVVSNVLVTGSGAVDSTDQVVGVTFYDTNSASPIIGASAVKMSAAISLLLVWNTLQAFVAAMLFARNSILPQMNPSSASRLRSPSTT